MCDIQDWDGASGIGCLSCSLGTTPRYSLGGGPACNLGSAMDKRYLPRMLGLLSGKRKFAAIKFRGLKRLKQFCYIENKHEMIRHLGNVLREVIAAREELESRGLLNTC